MRTVVKISFIFNSKMHPNLKTAIKLFNEEKFFAAHESMEEFWQMYHEPDRVYYQALIQLTVALHLYQESRLKGAQMVLERALKNMDGCQGLISGIDLIQLKDEIVEYFANPGKMPKIAMSHPER